MDKYWAALKISCKAIISYSQKYCGAAFTVIAALMCFISWDDINITSISTKLLVLVGVVLLSALFAVMRALFTRKRNIWSCGSGSIYVMYGDILKIGFPKKVNNNQKIIVIPVNTHFDTIVDPLDGTVEKPLVSPNTLHGRWLAKMIQETPVETLNTQIQSNLTVQNIPGSQNLLRTRGNQTEYPVGTTAIVSGANHVTYFLLALSRFDENNNAQCSDDDFFEALRKLVEFYDQQGQGCPLYIPIMGTNLSRAGYSHIDALNKIISILRLESEHIHGDIHVVIYGNDRNKVTIWQA